MARIKRAGRTITFYYRSCLSAPCRALKLMSAHFCRRGLISIPNSGCKSDKSMSATANIVLPKRLSLIIEAVATAIAQPCPSKEMKRSVSLKHWAPVSRTLIMVENIVSVNIHIRFEMMSVSLLSYQKKYLFLQSCYKKTN